MNLKELKEKIDEMYEKHGGEIDVVVCLTTDEGLDDTVFITDNEDVTTENIVEITETLEYPTGRVNGICLCNYIMDKGENYTRLFDRNGEN